MSFSRRTPIKVLCRRGFSLIEIMIVLVIIGIMAGAVTLTTAHWIDKARVNRARSDIGNYGTALNAFRAEKDRYPTNEEGLAILSPTYIEKIVSDPWRHAYQYNALGKDGFEVISFGRDGREGGTGPDADVSSQDLSAPEPGTGGQGG
jgi:general secretion pathway protein G